MGKDHAVVWTLANDDIAWCFCTLLLVLCSLNTVTKETAMMARELGRSSPDPRLGSMVELSCGNASGLLDLFGIGKALPGQGIAAEEPPPALLQVEKACSCRNEDVVEPWMRFKRGARLQAVVAAQIISNHVDVACRILRFNVGK